MFSQKELELYANQFKGFIQSCFNARMKALQDMDEDDEEADPFKRAIANNVKFQVAKVLDEEVKKKMSGEYARLQSEEQVRVN